MEGTVRWPCFPTKESAPKEWNSADEQFFKLKQDQRVWLHFWSELKRTNIKYGAVAEVTDEIDQATFQALVEAWHRERGASSSTTRIAQCTSYRSIVQDFGAKALPFIFKDLETHPYDPDHWFVALTEITNADPVPAKDRGNRLAMAKAWLKWARSTGHEW